MRKGDGHNTMLDLTVTGGYTIELEFGRKLVRRGKRYPLHVNDLKALGSTVSPKATVVSEWRSDDNGVFYLSLPALLAAAFLHAREELGTADSLTL